MRYVIFLFFIILSFTSKAQIQDSVTFSKSEVLRINNVLDSLRSEVDYYKRQQELNTLLVEEYKKNNEELNELLTYSDRYLKVREAQMGLVEQNLKDYQEYLKINKPAIWDRPVIWFVVGAGTIYFASTIVGNIR